jgi:6-pyruvoyltetrahydropterin/6-carboxytetrahydropterin synthase
MVMDLNVLMRILREKVLVEVDHKHMNRDVPFLQGVIPTAENVAVAFWKRIEPELRPYAGSSLRRVRIWESRGNYVEYHGERA